MISLMDHIYTDGRLLELGEHRKMEGPLAYTPNIERGTKYSPKRVGPLSLGATQHNPVELQPQ